MKIEYDKTVDALDIRFRRKTSLEPKRFLTA